MTKSWRPLPIIWTEATVDADNVLESIKNAVSDTIDNAIVEHRAEQNDPSASVGP
jgi:hypothetical protein